jgi:hypothetical protein
LLVTLPANATSRPDSIQNEIHSDTFIEHQDYAEILLYAENGGEVGRALVDLPDLPKVTPYKWHLASRKGKQYVETIQSIYMSIC